MEVWFLYYYRDLVVRPPLLILLSHSYLLWCISRMLRTFTRWARLFVWFLIHGGIVFYPRCLGQTPFDGLIGCLPILDMSLVVYHLILEMRMGFLWARLELLQLIFFHQLRFLGSLRLAPLQLLLLLLLLLLSDHYHHGRLLGSFHHLWLGHKFVYLPRHLYGLLPRLSPSRPRIFHLLPLGHNMIMLGLEHRLVLIYY